MKFEDMINKVIQGDCLEVMKDIPDNFINMILCDLPYGITQNKWDSEIDLHTLWQGYKRIIKKEGIIVLTASQPFSSKLVISNVKMFKHEWIWIKNKGSNFANTVREPFKEHEHILVFANKKWTYNKQMEKRVPSGLNRVKYNFKKVTTTKNYGKFKSIPPKQGELRVPSSLQKFNVDIGLHPTQKPLKLFEYLINTYSNENDIVLDNCIGSGTTAVACKKLNRRFIGIEISKDYCDIARKRINNVPKRLDKFVS